MAKTSEAKRFNTFALITSLFIVFNGITGRSYIYLFVGIAYFIYNLMYRIRRL